MAAKEATKLSASLSLQNGSVYASLTTAGSRTLTVQSTDKANAKIEAIASF